MNFLFSHSKIDLLLILNCLHASSYIYMKFIFIFFFLIKSTFRFFIYLIRSIFHHHYFDKDTIGRRVKKAMEKILIQLQFFFLYPPSNIYTHTHKYLGYSVEQKLQRQTIFFLGERGIEKTFLNTLSKLFLNIFFFFFVRLQFVHHSILFE